MQNILSARFEDALVYATQLHQDQFRKGTHIPYISHLLAVASLVIEAGGDEDEAIAALLHDGPEDQGGLETLNEIHTRFGAKVKMIVTECSDTFDEVKPPWRERKEQYLEHLGKAAGSTLLVSCADKLHNARAILTDYRNIGDDLWSRFTAGREGSLWYYRALVKQYQKATPPPVLVHELNRVVTELEKLTNK